MYLKFEKQYLNSNVREMANFFNKELIIISKKRQTAQKKK